MSIVILIACAAVFVYLAFITIRDYKDETGTTWDRLKAAFKYSATVAWARINALSVLLTTALVKASDALGIPGIKEAVEPYLTAPWLVAYALILAVGAEIARRRSL